MKVLYMGYFCNEELFNELVTKGTKSSHARQQLERKLLKGMSASMQQKDAFEIISYLPKVSGIEQCGEVWNGVKIKYVWCNKKNPFSVLKAIFSNIANIIAWGREAGEKVIFMYSVNPLHALPAFMLRKILGYKIVTLCPEVSNYRRVAERQTVARISRKIEKCMDNGFDGYVVLTEAMNEVVNRKNRPYIVMEGIAEPVDCLAEESEQREKAILYAGGLSEDNGIEILLDSFRQIQNNEWELWICGDGKLKEAVQRCMELCPQVKYYGILPNEQVLALEQKASFLINPRLSGAAFTKYSFPSKTIEYMETGTPVVLTRLSGIPDEYFEYVIVWEEETNEGMQKLMERLFSMSEYEIEQYGKGAKKFVLEKKGLKQQGNRVTEFLHEIGQKEVL